MPRVVVLGGGIAGLSRGILLAAVGFGMPGPSRADVLGMLA